MFVYLHRQSMSSSRRGEPSENLTLESHRLHAADRPQTDMRPGFSIRQRPRIAVDDKARSLVLWHLLKLEQFSFEALIGDWLSEERVSPRSLLKRGAHTLAAFTADFLRDCGIQISSGLWHNDISGTAQRQR
jgi:hypothetical protein